MPRRRLTHGSECSAAVRRALLRQAGVADAAVNLMLKSAAVTYDPALVTADALVRAIRDTGYESHLPLVDQTAVQEQEARDRRAWPAPEGA